MVFPQFYVKRNSIFRFQEKKVFWDLKRRIFGNTVFALPNLYVTLHQIHGNFRKLNFVSLPFLVNFLLSGFPFAWKNIFKKALIFVCKYQFFDELVYWFPIRNPNRHSSKITDQKFYSWSEKNTELTKKENTWYIHYFPQAESSNIITSTQLKATIIALLRKSKITWLAERLVDLQV